MVIAHAKSPPHFSDGLGMSAFVMAGIVKSQEDKEKALILAESVLFYGPNALTAFFEEVQ